VPYILFRLFLVHKILASKYICENGKRKGKRKRKRIFQLAGPGGFGPPGASARARARLRPTWPSCAGRRRGTAPWCGPARQREGGLTTLTARRKGGGEARAGEGGHGGGANFACGGLWRPVRGTVAGARGGDAAGEVAGHNRGGKMVPYDRESVAELLA
jgi:hypothetical protein